MRGDGGGVSAAACGAHAPPEMPVAHAPHRHESEQPVEAAGQACEAWIWLE